MSDIRVIIFEDNELIRTSLQQLLNSSPGFICCRALEDGRNWEQHIISYKPDVVLMDIEMPGLNGIELTKQMIQLCPDIKILIQTVFNDSEKIFKALCAGASGYILKTDTPQKYLDSIIEIFEGGAPMSSTVAKKTLSFFKNENVILTTPYNKEYNLTEREEEILRLMIDRFQYRDIASELFISYDTVKTHIKHIYKKLHVSSRSEAIMKAVQHGIFN